MRPAFVITGLGTGGAERVLLRLLQHSRWRGDALVISLKNGGDLAPEFHRHGIRLTALGMSSRIFDPRRIGMLARCLKNHRADVVSTWMYHADLVGGLAARMANVPVIWGIRNGTLHDDATSWTTRATVRAGALLSRCVPDRIVSCSNEARSIHEAIGYTARKFVVIPNGIDLAEFKPDSAARVSMREELGVDLTSPLVGMVARFDPQKDHGNFVAAAANVLRSIPDVQFVLAGSAIFSGNFRLRELIETAGVSNRFHLLGLRRDVPRILAALDVAVLSSQGEAFPSVVAEAMACGVPCVATDVGDASLIIGSTGIVVPPRMPGKLSEGIVRLLAEGATAKSHRSESCRRRVAEHFDLNVMVKRYDRLLKSVAKLHSLNASSRSALPT